LTPGTGSGSVRFVEDMGTVQLRRWTRREYDELIELGMLGAEDRIELLGGQLVVAEPQSPYHYTAICLISRALAEAFGPGWDVRSEGPVALDDESEPEPDVAVVHGVPMDYRDAHPSRPVLVVEVALSSLALDRAHKGSLYARAGLTDYWVVDLTHRALEVYREPVRDGAAAFGWRYGIAIRLSTGDSVVPLAAPDARVAVTSLLP
jgi:Uma2 family endonuclease